jgi:hypothetical protein
MTNHNDKRMRVIRSARNVRFLFWLIACACVGVLKVIYHGSQLFWIGLGVVLTLTLIGVAVERWIIRRWAVELA